MDEVTTETAEGAEQAPSGEAEAAHRWRLGIVIALTAAAALIISQAFLVWTLRETNDELGALRTELGRMEAALSDVSGSVGGLEGAVGDVGDRIDSLEEQRLALAPGPNSAAPDPEPQSPEPATGVTVVAATLPRFRDGVADPALGMVLGDVTAPEYYSGTTATYGPDDGVARAIFVWAHWCPYCQQEIPELADWVAANGADFSHFELVSITTSIDENGPNPLVPYLDDNQWPFPVLVDEAGYLAQQLGVNAFPFWVFTGPDGVVLGRTAGLLPIEQLDAIFRQLEDIGATA